MGHVIPFPRCRGSRRRCCARGGVVVDLPFLTGPKDPKVNALGKSVVALVVADRARPDAEQRSNLLVAAERLHNVANCDLRFRSHRIKQYSSHMNIVKRLEPEMTSRSGWRKLRAMAEAALQFAENPTSLEAIAHRLKLTRAALGLNQTQFCGLAGIARNTYNQWEKGVSRPELDKALALCEAHNLTLDWVYRGVIGGLPYELASKIKPAQQSA